MNLLPPLWPAVVPAGAPYLVEGAFAALLLWGGWRLRRALARRTRELRASEERWRTLFEHAGVVMIEEDFTAVVPRLDALRAAGVADLRAHLAAHPALANELYQLLRVTAANRAALDLLGGVDLAGINAGIRAFAAAAPSAAFLEKLAALWERRLAFTLETGLTGLDGVEHFGLMQCAVPTASGRPDFSRVLVAFTDLTALRTSEARFRELFENAVEGVYENSPEGGFRRANPAMARILGYASVADLLAVPPAATASLYVSATRRAEFFARLGENDQVADFESEVRRPDGTTAWITENVRAVRDAKGRLLHLQGVVADVTARKAAEAALRASEQRFRELYEHSPVAMIEIDSRGTVAWLHQLRGSGVTDLADWLAAHPEEARAVLLDLPILGLNPAALRLLAARTAGEVRASLPRLLTPEAVESRRAAMLAVWAGRSDSDGETRLLALDGTPRLVYQRWRVPRDGDRPMFERTQIALIDLTPIRAAEAELAAEREQLRVTLRTMTEGVITTDTKGVVGFINEAAAALLGWPATAAIGRPLVEVCVLRHETTGRAIAAPATAALAADRPVDLPPFTALQSRAGVIRLVEGRCVPMHDRADRAIGTVFLLRDVTDRARLGAELMRASKLESVGLLAGGIAHDFNNLLSIVTGNLALALLDEKTAAAGSRWLREAERGTLRARELTQQLLTLAKGGEPVRSAILLSDVVREAAEFALHGATVRCEFDLAADLRPANADKGQIGQVVQNLVINAVQAMPAGGVIRLSLHNETLAAGAVPPLPPGDYLRLDVADSGQGIAAEHLAQVFEPFFTTKEHGSGLGLATVYSVVQKHHGLVTVESAIGRGTTSHVWLPAAHLEPPAAPASAPPFELLRGRVLFMDDEEPIRAMTQALLERLGLEVTVAADGAQAVRQYAFARAGGRPFDVVIMDLTVPGAMGGAAAMAEILKLDPQARGIVSSGYSDNPVMANYRAHGFSAAVPKPYRVADFANALREIIAKR